MNEVTTMEPYTKSQILEIVNSIRYSLKEKYKTYSPEDLVEELEKIL